MTPRLSPEERDRLAFAVWTGANVPLDTLAHADRVYLEGFRPHPVFPRPSRPTAARASSEGTRGSDPLAEIAARLDAVTSGAPLDDPRGFLRNGNPNALAALLSPSDFDYVMKLRAQQSAPQPAPTPEPPAPTREQITADVKRLAADGKDAIQVARELNIGRTLAQAIIDGNV